MSEPAVGKGLPRVDARAKVTGEAKYAADTPVANVCHAVIVGATIGKGKVTAIDVAAAKKLPGVLAVLTHETIFDAVLFGELRALTDDQGAARILRARSDVATVVWEDGALDIDAPETLATFT